MNFHALGGAAALELDNYRISHEDGAKAVSITVIWLKQRVDGCAPPYPLAFFDTDSTLSMDYFENMWYRSPAFRREIDNMSILSIGRHGESEANARMKIWRHTGDRALFSDEVLNSPDWMWDLTEHGCLQAENVAKWRGQWLDLPDLRFSSPSPRAINTSRIIHGGQEPILLGSLVEQDWGDLNTKHPQEVLCLRKVFDSESMYNPDARPPNGETFREVCERVRPFADWLRILVRDNPLISIDVSCHYGVRRALLFILLGCSFSEYAQAQGPAWKSNNCQVAVLYGDANGRFYKLINVSPAVEEPVSFVSLL